MALPVINTGRQNSRTLAVPEVATRHTLTATEPTDQGVMLNLALLPLGTNDALPETAGQAPPVRSPLTP